MNKITFPLTQGAQSAAVGDLQDALQFQLDRERVLANDEAARREVSEALKPERAAQTYGSATGRLVSIFQEEQRLQASGEVDEPTAEALNVFLNEWGLLDRTRAPDVFKGLTTPHEFRIRGSLSGAEGSTRIEAWQRGITGDVMRASADVAADGTYLLELGPEVEGRPDVYLRVVHDGATVASTAGRMEWNLRPGATVLEIEVPADRRVEGQVRDADHRPAENVDVTLREFGGNRDGPLLGSARTDQDGRYAISFGADGPIDVELEVPGHPPVPRYGVGRYDLVDVTLGDVPWPGPSVVERVAADAQVLGSDHVLSENDAERVAARTGADPEGIRMLAVARRLGAELDIPAEIAYALVSRGLPEDADALAALPPSARSAAVDGALADNLIPLSARADVGAALTKLHDRQVRSRLDDRGPQDVGSLREALAAAGMHEERRQVELVRTVVDHEGIPAAGDAGIDAPALLALDLAALTGNNPPLISRVRDLPGVGALRDLADLDASGWQTLIAEADAPAPGTVVGNTDTERREVYARALAERLEVVFPAHAILGRATHDADLPEQQQLAHFVAAHPNFRLDGPPVAVALAEAADGTVDATVVARLESLQRVARIAPRYAEVRTLMQDGLDSAMAVTQLGETTFAERHAETFGDADAARSVHRQASQVSAAALNVLATLAPQFHVQTHVTPGGVPAPGAGMPDWEKLFGSADFCDCEHCRSVIGPAAYLTDILHFLEQRRAGIGRSAKDELFDRRPDLGEIELTCQNTNTTLPYIDLVNEVLEAAVSPRAFELDLGAVSGAAPSQAIRDAFLAAGYRLTSHAALHEDVAGGRWSVSDDGWHFSMTKISADFANVLAVPQTSGTSLEQDASPEHVHAPAYPALRSARYPWGLPYDLPLDETRTFLGGMNVERANLMRDFTGADGPSPGKIACERLGFAAGEVPLLTGAVEPWEAWGEATIWTGDLRVVRTLLDRAGLRFEELDELLRLRWINPGGVMRIEADPAADPYTCDTTKLVVAGLTPAGGDRIHRFTRIQRRLGWSVHELDRALALLPPGALDNLEQGFVVLSGLEELRRDLAVPLSDLLSWFAPLDTHRYLGAEGVPTPSQYDRLFRSRTVRQPGQVDLFELDAAGDELADVAFLAVDPLASDLDAQQRRSAIAGALGISQADLTLLVDGPDRVLFRSALANLAHLSQLHRIVVLARALRLSVVDLLAFTRLLGIEPFLIAATAITPADVNRVRTFVDAAAAVRASGATIAELDYYLAHRIDPRSPKGPSARTLSDLLTSLRGTLRAIRDDTRPESDPVGAVTERQLVAAGWSEDQAKSGRMLLLGATTIGREMVLQPGDISPPVLPVVIGHPVVVSAEDVLSLGIKLPAGLPARFIGATLQFTGVMTVAQRSTMEARSDDPRFRRAVAQLFDAPRQAAAEQFGTFPTGEPFLDAATVAQLFDTELSAQQRFELVLAKLNAHLHRVAGTVAVEELLTHALQLTGPSVEVLLTRWRADPAVPAARQLEPFLDPVFIGSSGPVTAESFPQLFRVLALLHKVADMVRRYRLPATQLELLLLNAPRLGWLDFGALPLDWRGRRAASLQLWLRMDQALRWQAALPVTEPTLLELLVRAVTYDPASDDPAQLKTYLLAGWTRATGWDLEELEALLGASLVVRDGGLLGLFLPAVASATNPFADEAIWLRVRRCFEAAVQTGASVSVCQAWSRPLVREGDASNARQAFRAHHDAESWPAIITPISDGLRERRRAALVAQLIHVPPENSGVSDADDLYAWFLLDVQMGACMTTSRIKQAISSVQLFAQRCLLNLERNVQTSGDEGWDHWHWMKTYRVWEAARKIFLWPENWVEPDLRDDKSPAFRELEEALAQNDLDDETARDALQGYLEHLEEVAQLEVIGLHTETATAPPPAIKVLHVIAKTGGTPARYFYRRRVNRATWTAWEHIDLDIEGEIVLPQVWNGRLHLLWPILTEVQEKQESLEMPEPKGKMMAPKKRWHIQLAWSEYKGGRWTPKRLTTEKIWGPSDLALAPVEDTATGDLVVILREYKNGREYTFDSRFRFSAATGNAAVTDQSGISIDGTRGVAWIDRLQEAPPPGVHIDAMAHHEDPRGPVNFTPWTPFAVRGIFGGTLVVLGDTPGTVPFRVRDEGFPALHLGSAMVFSDDRRSFFFEPRFRISPTRGVNLTLNALAFHHAQVRDFARVLRRGGINDLFARELQTATSPGLARYSPQPIVDAPIPIDEVDFSDGGAYSQYNWELFFHAPLLIADRLSRNQHFEEAQRWLHFIFDPTDRSSYPAPARYWRLRPFFETTDAERVMEQMSGTLIDPQLSDQVRRWQFDPFDPHTVARMRHTAYQRATVMKYLDNLIAWGDQLYRRDTIESINEATQLYVLAAEILGRRPETVTARARPVVQTYNTIASRHPLDALSNPLVAAETLIPPLEPAERWVKTRAVMLPDMRYFCIPRNDKLLGYWTTVGERLFNIRHCRNIEGVERQLALFEPPIDPAALIRAGLAGLDISDVISDAAAPLPPYRFSAMAQKATELCSEVKSLGAGLLSALEKRDAEAMALLRSTQEIEVLGAVRYVRQLQVDEAKRNLDALDTARELITLRRDYYAGQPFTNVGESTHLAMAGAAHILQSVAASMEGGAAVLSLLPEIKLGVPPTIGATYGGTNVASALRAFSGMVASMSSLMQSKAGLSLTMGGYERRAEEWRHQTRLADKELEQLDRQRAGADIKRLIAERELTNHDKQVANAADTRQVMEDKFTNRQLYDWMVGQVSGLYFRSYQLAYDVAKRTERAYRYELGLQDSSFIHFGSWDSLHKGLLAGERLAHELKRMEVSWLEENRRHYELTTTVSLALLDPRALLALRATGSCFLSLPEGLFDLDHPGHYLRRLKSVSLTIPAVAGPYTNVNATLTLMSSRIRTSASAAEPYGWTGPDVQDSRFTEITSTTQSIATSHGQRDAGVFQLDFRDERYLPFEGQGAFSRWRLELDPDSNRFDLATVSDVLLHVSYTARDGGTSLKQAAKAALVRAEVRLVNVRQELPAEWQRFLHASDSALYDELLVDVGRWAPYRPGNRPGHITHVDVYAKVRASGDTIPVLPLELQTGADPASPDVLAGTPLKPVPGLGGLSVASADGPTLGEPGDWRIRIAGVDVPRSLRRTVSVDGKTFHHLDPEALTDMYLAIQYMP